MGGGPNRIDNNQSLTSDIGGVFSQQLTSLQKDIETLQNKLIKLNSSDKLNLSGGELTGTLEIQDTLTLNDTAKTNSLIPQDDDEYNLGSEDKGWDNAYVHQLWGSSILTIGNSNTSHNLTNNNDLLISGDLEVDGNTFLDGNTTFGGTIDAGNNLISNLLDPISAQDAVTKAYYEANTPTGVFSRTGATIAPTTAGDAINFTNNLITFDSLQTFGGSTLTKLGYLSSASSDIQIQLTGLDTDKEDSLTKGNITAGTGITLTGDITDAVIGSGFTISLPQSIATTATPIFAGATISIGGIDVTGASTFNNNLTVNGLLGITDTLTVSSGGMDVTGDSTITGSATVTNDLTVGGITSSGGSPLSIVASEYKAHKIDSRLSPYYTVTAANFNGSAYAGIGATTNEYVVLANQSRIRYDGDVTFITLLGNISNSFDVNLDDFRIKFWRYDGTNTCGNGNDPCFDLVGMTEDICDIGSPNDCSDLGIVNGVPNKITLTTKVKGIKEGDFYSIYWTRASACAGSCDLVGSRATSEADLGEVFSRGTPSLAGEENKCFNETTVCGGTFVLNFGKLPAIEIGTDYAPQMIVFGSSILGGKSKEQTTSSFRGDDWATFDNLRYYKQIVGVGRNIANKTGMTVVNMTTNGMGSAMIDLIQDEIVAVKPRLVLTTLGLGLEMSWNQGNCISEDLGVSARVSLDEAKTIMRNSFNTMIAAGVVPIYSGIQPYEATEELNSMNPETSPCAVLWDNEFKNLIHTEIPKAKFVDYDAYIGEPTNGEFYFDACSIQPAVGDTITGAISGAQAQVVRLDMSRATTSPYTLDNCDGAGHGRLWYSNNLSVGTFIDNENINNTTTAANNVLTVDGDSSIELWQANKTYAAYPSASPTPYSDIGEMIYSFTDNCDGRVLYQLTTLGTTGATEPAFACGIGQTTADGTAVWTSRGKVSELKTLLQYQYQDERWNEAHVNPAANDRMAEAVLDALTNTPQEVFLSLLQNTNLDVGILSQIAFETTITDSHGYWDRTNKVFHPKTGGYYMIAFTAMGTGVGIDKYLSVVLYKNNATTYGCSGATSTIVGADKTYSPIAAGAPYASTSSIVHLNGNTDWIAPCFVSDTAGTELDQATLQIIKLK